MAAAINYMWEFQPNVLIMHCNTTKDNDKCKNPQTGVVNNTFIWDLKTETIRESKFVLDPEYQDLQVDIYGTPSFSMFRTFFFDNKGTGKAKLTSSATAKKRSSGRKSGSAATSRNTECLRMTKTP